jgi:hypothetical protein
MLRQHKCFCAETTVLAIVATAFKICNSKVFMTVSQSKAKNSLSSNEKKAVLDHQSGF